MKKTRLLFLLVACVYLITGCSSKSSLTEDQKSVTQFVSVYAKHLKVDSVSNVRYYEAENLVIEDGHNSSAGNGNKIIALFDCTKGDKKATMGVMIINGQNQGDGQVDNSGQYDSFLGVGDEPFLTEDYSVKKEASPFKVLENGKEVTAWTYLDKKIVDEHISVK